MIDMYVAMGITLFEAICVVIFFDCFLERKRDTHKFWGFVVITLAVFAETFIVPFFFQDTASLIQTVLKYTIGTLIISIICWGFYKVKYIKAVALSAAIFVLIYFVDYIGLAVTDLVTGKVDAYMQADIPTRLFYATLYKASLFLTLMIIRTIHVKLSRNRHEEYQTEQVNNKFRWFLYFLTPTICIVSIAGIFSLTSSAEHSNPLLLLMAIGWLFMCIVFFFFLQIADDREAKYRTSLIMEQSVQTELEGLRAIAIVNENYHDYQNDMIAIKNYLSGGKPEMALEYINKLPYAGSPSTLKFKTGNEVVDAILNQKYWLAKKKGIHILPTLSDLGSLNIGDRDLVAILSNMLDNAIEACEAVEQEKVIQLKIVKEDGNLIIAVKNPTAQPVAVVDGRVATSKREKHLHGFGMRNIQRTLDKYDSSYSIKSEGNSFTYSAVIPVQTKE